MLIRIGLVVDERVGWKLFVIVGGVVVANTCGRSQILFVDDVVGLLEVGRVSWRSCVLGKEELGAVAWCFVAVAVAWCFVSCVSCCLRDSGNGRGRGGFFIGNTRWAGWMNGWMDGWMDGWMVEGSNNEDRVMGARDLLDGGAFRRARRQ